MTTKNTVRDGNVIPLCAEVKISDTFNSLTEAVILGRFRSGTLREADLHALFLAAGLRSGSV
jgi:hypothetical protein